MSNSIADLVNDLPNRSVTVYVLDALDFVVPGQWQNITNFEALVKEVTKETDPKIIQAVTNRANALYSDPNERYQRAMSLYNLVDKTDRALASAALANKVGQQIRLLSFLDRLTPKADTAQTIDFSLKLITELLTFCLINGIPGDSVNDFVKSLADYGKESLMRMAALVCIDGLIPLGPDFAQKSLATLGKLSPEELQRNATYKALASWIPGNSVAEHLSFITSSVNTIKSWIDDFLAKRDLTPEKVANSVQHYIEITDNRLDYLAAFLDLSTSYYSHTGTQSLARRIIERAVNEI